MKTSFFIDEIGTGTDKEEGYGENPGLKDKQKELRRSLNAMLSDRLTLHQGNSFAGASQQKVLPKAMNKMNIFNEAEASADAETEELFEEIPAILL